MEAIFSIDLLRLTRSANAHAKMFVVLEGKHILDTYPDYARQLNEIHVSVHYQVDLAGPSSRSNLYAKLHAAANHSDHPPDMETRYCEWADLALMHNLDRVLTLDADVAVFQDVDEVFHNYTEDIISPCSQCSQVVLWKTSALSHHCDAYIEYMLDIVKGNRILNDFYGLGSGLYFGDMLFLHIYTHERWVRENNETFVFLTENNSRSARNPNPMAWLPGISVMIFNVPFVTSKLYEVPRSPPINWWADLPSCSGEQQCCPNYTENIKWRGVQGSLQVPSLLDGTLVPIIHFNSFCKVLVVHDTFLRLKLLKAKHHYSYFFIAQVTAITLVPSLLIAAIMIRRWW